MNRKPYPTDLTDAQWERIEPLIPPAKPGGRPRSADMREVVNAMLYLTRTGCQWRNLPHEFFRPGARSTTIIDASGSMAAGKGFTTLLCASRCGSKRKAGRPLPARRSSIPRV